MAGSRLGTAMKEIARKKGSLLITEGLSPSSHFACIQVSSGLARFSSVSFFISVWACDLPRCSSEWGRQLATRPLPSHPFLAQHLSLVSAFFKSLAAVDDDGAEQITLTERVKDFLMPACEIRANFTNNDQLT